MTTTIKKWMMNWSSAVYLYVIKLLEKIVFTEIKQQATSYPMPVGS